jgi:F-type H+-transporting ATPase subunit b
MLLGSAGTTTTTTPIFLIPNGTFLVELVIFIIVLGIVARVILPPLTAARREREERIRAGVEAGEDARSAAAQLDDARRETLERARAEARSVLAEAQRAAEELREAARARGQAEYDRLVTEAQGVIEQERQATIERVSASLEGLVVDAAQRIVGAPVNAADHHDAIERVRAALSGEGE